MDSLNIVASIAGLCTTVSFFPQVIKIYRTKHTKDLSLAMYVIFMCGVALWAAYGFLAGSLPIVLANGVTFALSSYILMMKLIFK